MRKHQEIVEAANQLYTEVSQGFAKYAEVKDSAVKAIAEQGYDEAFASVTELVEGVKAIVDGCRSESGIAFPEHLVRFVAFETAEGGKLASINLVVRSKLKDELKYKKEAKIFVGDKLLKEITDAYTAAIFEMYYQHQADANLAEVNAFVDGVCTQNGIPYRFKFAVTDSRGFVEYIDNKNVVFSVSVEDALDISKNGMFNSGDEYLDYIRDQLTSEFVAALLAAQTTVQLIKANIPLVVSLVGGASKKRADKIIRMSYKKNAEYLKNMKKGYGYFEMEADGKRIFSIIEKREDGEFAVSLNPFDIETLLAVDTDVVAELSKKLA